MGRIGILLAAAMLACMVSGCRSILQPLPGPGREGEFYTYTARYDDPQLGFSLLGKSMCMGLSKSQMRWEEVTIGQFILALPFSAAYLAEWFVVCPVVDTVMTPYDFIIRTYPRGLAVRLEDESGQPIEGVELDFRCSARGKEPIVYKGCRRQDSDFTVKVKTDKSGCARLPVKLSSCGRVTFTAELMLNGEEVSMSGCVDDDSWSWKTKRHQERHNRKPKNGLLFSPYFRQSPCYICRKGDSWTGSGRCKTCGKRSPERWRVARRLTGSISLTYEESKEVIRRTGATRKELEETFSIAPDSHDALFIPIRFADPWKPARRRES